MKKLEINRRDLKNNIDIIKKIAYTTGKDDEGNNLKIIAVVKGNGIGLDIKEYSKFLINNGITTLAVSNVEEAIKLREIGIKEDIIMLSPVPLKKELKTLIEQNIILTISSLKDVLLIEEIVQKNEKIQNVQAHLKIDTGLGRYGVLYTNKEEILKIFEKCKKIKIVGTYTHFSKPIDEKCTNKQFNRFLEVISFIKMKNFNPGILHCCASTAFLKYPMMHLNAIRIGSAFQGRTLVKVNNLKQIGEFKTNIVEIKKLPKGYTISYNNTYKTKRETTIAIIPVGYMDGFNKSKMRDDFSLKNNIIAIGMEIKKIFRDNKLKVKINDKNYNIIGKIGMYHTIIDITNSVDIKVGDVVTVELTPLQTNEEIRREYV